MSVRRRRDVEVGSGPPAVAWARDGGGTQVDPSDAGGHGTPGFGSSKSGRRETRSTELGDEREGKPEKNGRWKDKMSVTLLLRKRDSRFSFSRKTQRGR